MAVLGPARCCAKQLDYGDRSWCDCSSDVSCKQLGDKLQCSCGEEWQIYEWNWENDSSANNIILSNNNRDVIFHPVYSSGTAAVRGEQLLKQNAHYYWEIKMLTNLYGTDIMVGVGTSKVVLSDWKLRFCSMLGYDQESWGYSYTGRIQHGKLSCNYGSRFSLGSLIGVHLDMCAGTLEYYLNRKPLGIAFRGLKKYELYPMVSSTAAQSAMRITCALSEVPTLQIECLKIICNDRKLLQQYWSIPGLARMVGKKYFWLVPRPPPDIIPKLELEDEVVLPVNYTDLNFVRRKRFCTGLLHRSDARADPDHVNYRQLLTTRKHLESTIKINDPINLTYDYNSNISSKSDATEETAEASKPGCSGVERKIIVFNDSNRSIYNFDLDRTGGSGNCIGVLADTESEDSDLE